MRFRTNSTQDAQDIVSDVFMKALKSIDRYDEQHAFSTWIFTITRRTLIDFWRKQKSTFDIDAVYDLADESVNLNASCDIKMRVEYIMDQLNEPERNLIVMRYEQDLTFKEISAITGKSEGSLRTAFSRLKKVIKDLPNL